MTEAVWIALLGTVQAVSVAVIGVLGTLLVRRVGAMQTDVAAVKYEVKNDHKTNMREEQDTRHEDNSRKLDQILDSIVWLARGWRENREDITDLLEQTGQPVTRRARRLAAERPPMIRYDDLPMSRSNHDDHSA